MGEFDSPFLVNLVSSFQVGAPGAVSVLAVNPRCCELSVRYCLAGCRCVWHGACRLTLFTSTTRAMRVLCS
jgi:hypothetical protein